MAASGQSEHQSPLLHNTEALPPTPTTQTCEVELSYLPIMSEAETVITFMDDHTHASHQSLWKQEEQHIRPTHTKAAHLPLFGDSSHRFIIVCAPTAWNYLQNRPKTDTLITPGHSETKTSQSTSLQCATVFLRVSIVLFDLYFSLHQGNLCDFQNLNKRYEWVNKIAITFIYC